MASMISLCSRACVTRSWRYIHPRLYVTRGLFQEEGVYGERALLSKNTCRSGGNSTILRRITRKVKDWIERESKLFIPSINRLVRAFELRRTAHSSGAPHKYPLFAPRSNLETASTLIPSGSSSLWHTFRNQLYLQASQV